MKRVQLNICSHVQQLDNIKTLELPRTINLISHSSYMCNNPCWDIENGMKSFDYNILEHGLQTYLCEKRLFHAAPIIFPQDAIDG